MKQTKSKNNRVILGLSGGVDSAVAAALLKEKGYEVIARYIKGYAPPGVQCPEEKDIADARRIALALDIDFKVVNEGSEVYRKSVYTPFINEYFSGRTPNPDIHCNQFVKFPILMKKKEEYKADFIATGHYIKRAGDRLFAATDSAKDQSYFLYAVPREILSQCLFPIGEFNKDEVRRMAEERGIHVAKKKGTRGVCMVGELSLPEAIQMEADSRGYLLKPAQAILVKEKKDETEFEELGTLPGGVFLASTVGQRNGFGIAYRFPIYVVWKDVENCKLYFKVMPEGSTQFKLSSLNWVSPKTPEFPFYGLVKIRTPGRMLKCTLDNNGGNLEVVLENSDPGIAPGQSAVFYRETSQGVELLGGGIIQ